jgi:cytochrome c553
MAGEGRPGAGYPRIAGQPAAYLERQLDAYADGRRESQFMTPIAQRLSAQERRDAARHFAGQTRSADLVQTGGRGQALATRGDHKLRVQACNSCHGPGGSGRAPSTPYLAGLDREYLARELRAWKSGERRSDPSGAMALIARSLPEADIDALAAHYAGVPPAAPR